MPRSVPTVRQRRLGRDLRQLREDRGLSSDSVAAQMGWSASKVTRIETAFSKVAPADVSNLLDLYGVSSETRAALIHLAHEAQQRGWWTEYGDVFTDSYIASEDEAEEIRVFEAQLIPGLLQTEDYARAVIEAGRPDDPADIDRRVRARMARKVLLTRPNAPRLTTIIAEPALRWPIGGPAVMRAQLRALLEAAERPNVEIRALPMSAGAHAGLDGPCVILSFGEDDFPDVAYTVGMTGENYVESADQVQRVTMAWNRIAGKALSAEETVALIATLAKE
jgi:transcriptional regulator with XRE-family HTH domain